MNQSKLAMVLSAAAFMFSSGALASGLAEQQCATRDGKVFADYLTFNSVADQYSSVTIQVTQPDGSKVQVENSVDKAAVVVSVQLPDGRIAAVKPDFNTGICSIKVN